MKVIIIGGSGFNAAITAIMQDKSIEVMQYPNFLSYPEVRITNPYHLDTSPYVAIENPTYRPKKLQPAAKAKRRAKNKAEKKARKINRRKRK